MEPSSVLIHLVSFLILVPFSFSLSSSSSSVDDDLRLPPNANFPYIQGEKLIRQLNLFPAVSDAGKRDSHDERRVHEPPLVEKNFRFPNVVGDDDSVENLGHHAGYYNIEHSHAARMFYFFFESRGSKKDPVVIWLTGGPGCSSELAVFYENGPFTIADNMSLVWNDYGWDKASNLIYVDQPTGTGFSYSTDIRDTRHNELGVSNDLYDFLQLMVLEKGAVRDPKFAIKHLQIFFWISTNRVWTYSSLKCCKYLTKQGVNVFYQNLKLMQASSTQEQPQYDVGSSISGAFEEVITVRDSIYTINDSTIQEFFKEHPQYADNDFYITGESYAGHYIPSFASRIHQGNKDKEGIHINLKGFAIGNGLTDPAIQYRAYTDYALEMGLIQESDYKRINKFYPACEFALKLCGTKGTATCLASYVVCNSIFNSIMGLAGQTNYYDIRKQCEGKLCYDFSNMEKFLNQNSVRTALGVGDREFVSCSPTVYEAMLMDWMRNMEVGIPSLIEDGIKLLVYAGEYDLVCNWLGNSRWVHSMEWSGNQEFVASPNVPFMVDGVEAGLLKSIGPLSFLKVHDAGHMVPMDQPKAALEMLKRWTQGKLADGETGGVSLIAEI